MNIFTIDNIGSLNGTVTYEVLLQGYDSVWNLIYEGRVYILPGQTAVDIDLGDILWNHKFDGTGFVEPKHNTEGDNYVMCSVAPNLPNPWFNKVRVVLGGLYTAEKWVCFFDYSLPFYNKSYVSPLLQNVVPLNLSYQPVAHLPKYLPDGVTYRQLVFNGSFSKGVDGSTTVEQRTGLGVIEFTGANETYSLNGNVIAKIDPCSKSYYLIWMTKEGGLQCQGFLKSSEERITYNNNERVDMSNWRWNFNRSVTGRITLRSGLLNDADYHAYGQLFASRYLILIDTENDRMYYVNVKDSDYVRKRNSSKGRIFFEVTVETAEIQTL